MIAIAINDSSKSSLYIDIGMAPGKSWFLLRHIKKKLIKMSSQNTSIRCRNANMTNNITTGIEQTIANALKPA
jgi:hypothetical protein